MSVCVNTFKHVYLCNQRTDRNKIVCEASFGWGGGEAALGFGPDRIRTLVSMASNDWQQIAPIGLKCGGESLLAL